MKLYHEKQNIFVLMVLVALLFLIAILPACQWDWLLFISRPSSESFPTVRAIYEPPASGEGLTREYRWKYEGRDWTWTLDMPEGLYRYYQSIERAPTSDYSIYVTHPEDDSYIEELAASLKQEAGEQWFDAEETLNFAASFVHGLKYEEEEGEYPKYPLETLVDYGGDCEDTAILMAALLQSMGYDVVLLYFFPVPPNDAGHMAVGVSGEGISSGWKYEINGKDYRYLETTRKSEVGEIPPEYENRDPIIYELLPIPILKLTKCKWATYGGIIQSDTVIFEITVTNWGTADAKGAYILVFFTGEEDKAKKSNLFNLEFGYEIFPITVKEIPVPSGGGLLWVQLFHGGIADEMSLEVEI